MQLLTQLNEEQKITIILVTHEPDISTFTRRIIQFKDGVVLQDRLQQPLKRQTKHETYLLSQSGPAGPADQ